MNPIAERGDVWAATIADKLGSLANTLAGPREAGAHLNFILARRKPDQPGKSVVYVTPLAGDAELEAAATLGFNLTARAYSVRVEGQNQPGIAAGLAAKLSAAVLKRPCSTTCHPSACSGSMSLPSRSPTWSARTGFMASDWVYRPRSRAKNGSAGGWIPQS